MKEYDLVGSSYRKVRSPEIGIPELVACAETFEQPISILDVGCGNGFPIAEKLIKYSNRYLGIDSSSVLANEFSKNIPNSEIIICSMDEMELNNELFDFVFGFGSFFHLPPEQQKIALAKAASAVAPNGKFIFTSHNEEGYCEGKVNGVPVPHWSLNEIEYVELMNRHNLTFEGYNVGSGGNGFYSFTAKSS